MTDTQINWPTPQEWVEALGSGKYAKGRRSLTDGKGAYCCLGVLCEMTEGVVESWTNLDVGFAAGGEWIGAGYINLLWTPEYLSSQMQAELGDINDSSDTFTEVIEYIKTNIIGDSSD